MLWRTGNLLLSGKWGLMFPQRFLVYLGLYDSPTRAGSPQQHIVCIRQLLWALLLTHPSQLSPRLETEVRRKNPRQGISIDVDEDWVRVILAVTTESRTCITPYSWWEGSVITTPPPNHQIKNTNVKKCKKTYMFPKQVHPIEQSGHILLALPCLKIGNSE